MVPEINLLPEMVPEINLLPEMVPEVINQLPEVINQLPEVINLLLEVINQLPEVINQLPEVINLLKELVRLNKPPVVTTALLSDSELAVVFWLLLPSVSASTRKSKPLMKKVDKDSQSHPSSLTRKKH